MQTNTEIRQEIPRFYLIAFSLVETTQCEGHIFIEHALFSICQSDSVDASFYINTGRYRSQSCHWPLVFKSLLPGV